MSALRLIKITTVCLVVLAVSCSCKHSTNFSSLPVVSYKDDISPIIIGNCTQSGCHGTVNHEGFKLEGYQDLIHYCDVKAGSPEKSSLYNILVSYGDDRMPRKPYKALSDQQIQLIYAWIGQGALDN